MKPAPEPTTQTNWAATLAPVGIPSQTGQIIDPACVVTVRDGASLIASDRTRIGTVTEASIVDGHLTVTGTLDPDGLLPFALPTFDTGMHDRRTFSPMDSDRPNHGTTTFHTLTVSNVWTGFQPAWDDPEIRFARDWCIHLTGMDDLVPMPDLATAKQAAIRFNRWWRNYRGSSRRRGEGYVDLPDVSAVVRPWPYDAEDPDGHAKALAELRQDDPDGWLST
jgi:hypothetical protein